MTPIDDDPTKRIPKSIGTETKLLGTYTLTDVVVGLLPGVLGLLVMQVLLPPSLRIAGYQVQALTLPLAAGAIGLGALFVYLTPAYTTSVSWVATFIGFHRSQKQLDHDAAKTYTQLERVHPERDAIERTDGALLGVVQVDPPTMALATDEEWAAKTDAFEEFLNTSVEFPIQLYSTTQPFPAAQYLERYEARLDDPDVAANPKLEALIEHYIEWYASELEARRMTIRDHYVVVPVTPAEVQFEAASLTQQLAELPAVGWLVRLWLAPRQPAQHQALFDALDERVRQVRLGLREIDGCETRRVEATAATRLVGEFWAGEARAYDDMHRVLRTSPIVGEAA